MADDIARDDGYRSTYGSRGQWKGRSLREQQREADQQADLGRAGLAQRAREGSLERQFGREQGKAGRDFQQRLAEEQAEADKWASLIGGGAGLVGSLGGAFLGGPLGAAVLGPAAAQVAETTYGRVKKPKYGHAAGVGEDTGQGW